MIFPLPFIPAIDYHGNGAGWNADRTPVGKAYNAKMGKEVIPGGVLKHAAVDLVGPVGTPILAIDRGYVVRRPEKFYEETYELQIMHPRFLARYCEIDRDTIEVKHGDWVEAGQVIAYIGQQTFHLKMLHLELYRNRDTSTLIVGYAPEYAPFYRRKDVYNPTKTLDEISWTAIRKLSKSYDYELDVLDRKFLKKLPGSRLWDDVVVYKPKGS